MPLPPQPIAQPYRRRLPIERQAITHKFSVAGHEGYLTVGLYENGVPGEIFISMAKEGSTVSGLVDSFAISTSLALQYGVPLNILCEKFTHTRFEPSGYTPNPEIRYAKSIMDYIFRWLELKFLPMKSETKEVAIPLEDETKDVAISSWDRTHKASPSIPGDTTPVQPGVAGVDQSSDAPSCSDCGAIMVRSGACYKCMNCGSTSGCS